MQTPFPFGDKPRGSRVRLSVRALMLLVVILGAWLGWITRAARIQRQSVAAIEKAGGSVWYDWQSNPGMTVPGQTSRPLPGWPRWLVDRLGIDYFGHVVHVQFFKATDADMVHIGRLSGVESINLTASPGITDVGIAQLAGQSTLRSLSLVNASITDAGVVHLRGLTGLFYLNIDRTRITDVGLAQLRNVLAGLKTLRMSLPGVTDDGLNVLKDLTNLEHLYIGGDGITDAGLAHLAGLTRLRLLALFGPGITDAGMVHLQGMTEMDNLVLTSTRVGNAGLASLSRMTRMEVLGLGGTQVGDAGLAHLAGMKRLQELHLWETKVTDAGLSNLNGLSKLRRLFLDGTQVTAAGVATLQTALPATSITSGP